MLSLTGKKWRMANGHQRAGAALAQVSGLHPVVANILAGRGYDAIEQAEAFLSPNLGALPDPATLKDIDVAVARVAAALENSERIAVFGDYDVDGTAATALMTRYFRALGVEPLRYVPDRLTEGYGPSPAAMQVLHGKGVQLVMTVDTGIAAQTALEEAQRLGMDVVVTDHHPPHGPLPPAVALVDPNRADDTSDLQGLCGTGVAFYLLMALNRYLRERGFFSATRPEPKLGQWLDLVALATVCDVMPLTAANRILVAKGLQQLGTWRHRGLATLAEVAGVKDNLSASTFGFALGPRLNAAGRLESALAAVELLLADDDSTALPLARQLDALNHERRELEQATVAEAMAMAEAMVDDTTALLVLANPAWHPGVVGLAASRVKERTGRPTFILGGGEGGTLKGSGRSVEGIDLGAAVGAAQALLVSGGGHAMAAGLTLDAAKLDALRAALNAHVLGQVTARPDYDAAVPLATHLAPTLTLESEVIPASCTVELARLFTRLEPFGNGNPEPLLALSKVQVAYAKPVGKTQEHLKLRLAGADGSQLDAIAFGAMNTPLGPALTSKQANALTLAGHLRINTFMGNERVDFQVVDGRVG
ncbi:MAG: single-stranded-DNA-specific exonuclease RecJ [Pseudomonadaceae bacterium]|nr:single-stranded-DNA-specific exonuclease RecJ [Pseudomonadaceae bacterium]